LIKGFASSLIKFKTESIIKVALSEDGNQLALIRGTSVTNRPFNQRNEMRGGKLFGDYKRSLNLIYDKRRNNLTR
jgi:hypothetical protein